MDVLKSSIIIVSLVGMSLLHSFRVSNDINNGVIENPESQHAVIVELFTSQGCSSCPAADKVLSSIIDQSESQELPIFGLSFHVDYWNRLGWKDPYSSKAFTERQYTYAKKIEASSVYTPQMIINGKVELIGSRAKLAIDQIHAALNETAVTIISATRLTSSRNEITVDYKATQSSKNLLINTALVERGLFNNVTRGENRGKKLAHDNIVRGFSTHELKPSGTVSLKLPSDLNLEKSSIILYVQDPESFEILDGIRVSLQ